MSRIIIDVPNLSAMKEIIALVQKLDGTVVEVETKSTENPFKYLKRISDNGGLTTIADASEWQREVRKDKDLVNR
jgi:glycine cleavage system H lipoate-binding protein